MSEIIKKKKTARGVPHMLAPRIRCLGYSKVYCDVRKRWLLAWNKNKPITHYILHIPYTNSVIRIVLLYIFPHFVWWQGLNHCATLVRSLATSILLIFYQSFVMLLIILLYLYCCCSGELYVNLNVKHIDNINK